MSDYRARMLEEYRESTRKINKLKEFKYDELSDIDKADLKEQLKHMKACIAVLSRRVSIQCNN